MSSSWDERPLAELAAHIVTHHHAALRTQLLELADQARRLRARRLAGVLDSLRTYALLHMEKEERTVFPLLCSGSAAGAAGPVQSLELEHLDHLATLARLETLAAALPLSDGSKHLRDGLARMRTSEAEHIRLENHLFSRALIESI